MHLTALDRATECSKTRHLALAVPLRDCHLEGMSLRCLSLSRLQRASFALALALGSAAACGCGGASAPPGEASPATASTGAADGAGDVAGGQSGGQTSEGVGSAPYPCACLPEGTNAVRARIISNETGCVELEALEVLGAGSELQPGDRFGGAAQALCWNDAPLAGVTEVLAVFSPGQQAGEECVEYRACSAQRCGRLEDAYSSSVDPECAARRSAGEPVDCQPIEIVDEAAVAAWDRCNSGCLAETRSACAGHEEEARLGGTVRMGPLTGEQLSFFWAGETRSESLAELSAPECQGRHNEIAHSYFQRRQVERAQSGQMSSPTAAAPPAPVTPRCPLPR